MGNKFNKYFILNSTLPELTGPYSSVIATEQHTKENTNISDEVRRLGDFVHLISKAVDVRNRYTQEELKEHTSFIEDNMQVLAGKLGELNPLLSSKQLLRRGSSYSGTKVLRPDEYDLMPILGNFNTSTLELEEVKDTCLERGKGYGYIKIKPEALSKLDDKYTRDRPNGKYLSCKKLSAELVIQSIKNMDTLHYIGVQDHDRKPVAPYKRGDISIHYKMHGPSIWLRIGGPLCTTDVDLCFSLEGPPIEQLGPCLMVASHYGDVKCNCGYTKSEHWMISVINPPVNKKYVLSESHQELFLTLKFISNLAAEISDRNLPSILSSYDINTLLLHHQQTCLAGNVGECFQDILWRILDEPDDMKNINIYSYTGLTTVIHDVFFPQRELQLDKSLSIAAITWFMLQVMHTEDNSWIHTLLSLTQEAHTHTWWNKQLTQTNSKELRGLVKVIRKVDSWFGSSSTYLTPLRLEWYHIDGKVKSSLTLVYERGLLEL